MKGIMKSIGIVLLFFVSQIIGMITVCVYTAVFNIEWYYRLMETLQTSSIDSAAYLSCIAELVYPTLIIADILLAIPFVIHLIRKKQAPIKSIKRAEVWELLSFGIFLNVFISLVVSLFPSGNYDSLMNTVMQAPFVVTLLITGVATPVLEEFVFRYAIIRFNQDKGMKAAIFISALLFGVAHMNLVQSTYAFFLGLILGWLYVKEGNLLPSIILHIAINASSVIWEYWPTAGKEVPCIVIGISLIYVAFKACTRIQAHKQIWVQENQSH